MNPRLLLQSRSMGRYRDRPARENEIPPPLDPSNKCSWPPTAARTSPSGPSHRPSKRLGTKSDAYSYAPARFTHKMPLLPQPNCQRATSHLPQRGHADSPSDRQGSRSPDGTHRPRCPSPVKLYLPRTSEALSIPVRSWLVKGQRTESRKFVLLSAATPLECWSRHPVS